MSWSPACRLPHQPAPTPAPACAPLFAPGLALTCLFAPGLLVPAAVFCQALEATAVFYDPAATEHMNAKNLPYKLSLQPDQLLSATYEFNKVATEAHDLDRLGVCLPAREGDPLRNCPCCSLTARTHLDDGASKIALPASPACQPCLPALPASPACHPCLPALPAIPACHPCLPALPASPACKPCLQALHAVRAARLPCLPTCPPPLQACVQRQSN